VLVAAAGASRIDDVDRGVQILHRAGATPAGIVLNNPPRGGRSRADRSAASAPAAADPTPAPAPAPADQQLPQGDGAADDTGRLPVIPAEERAGLPTNRG
jgi:hypothetical protein